MSNAKGLGPNETDERGPDAPSTEHVFKFVALSKNSERKYKTKLGVSCFIAMMPGEIVLARGRKGGLHKQRIGDLIFRDNRNGYSVYAAYPVKEGTE